MKSIFATLVLCAVYLSSSVVADGAKRSLKICPIKGQQFPAPTLLSEDPGFQNATRTIEDFIRANLTQSPFNETTFSMGIFSADQEGLIYEYHHADAKLKNSTIGATTVDADSIYRIGSISKIFTVYLWLITQGDRKFSDPISEHIPQLLEINREQHDYVLPDWTEITVGDLASYLAGIARDYGLNDVAMPNYVTSLLPAMVSDLSVETLQREVPVCGFMTSNRTYNTCSQDIYIRGIQDLAASFPTAYTPSYSNANYALLGIALSNIVGASMDEIFNSSLARPLGLTATTPGNPRTITDKSVIPGGDEIKSGWQDVLGPLDAAAGVFSSINDLARLGRSILNHDLLSSAVTRRWYNSMSFVDHTSQAIGRGWEVFRLDGAGHTVDVYTKSGYCKMIHPRSTAGTDMLESQGAFTHRSSPSCRNTRWASPS
jgi:CubicO group peptidase (beta-lactamase class C family)